MLTLTHVRTFIHADGPVEFEARDAQGRSYLAGLVEYRDEGDVSIVVPASEDEIAAVAAGSADTRRLFLANGAAAWYLSAPYAGAGAFRAHRQSTQISDTRTSETWVSRSPMLASGSREAVEPPP